MNNLTRMLKTALAIVLLAGFAGSAMAKSNFSDLPKRKHTVLGLYMPPQQAYDQAMKYPEKTLFVDIRTPSEVNYLGAATVMDKLVPWVFMDSSGWNDRKHRYKRRTNKNFVADMNAALKDKGLTKKDTVILMCRSGDRSAKAVNLLAKNGYTKVYTVVTGFEGDKAKKGKHKGKRALNGWKNDGLPWTYSQDKDRMYLTK